MTPFDAGEIESDADVLEWFLRVRGQRTGATDAPIGRLIRVLRGYARGRTPGPPPEAAAVGLIAASSNEWFPAICDLYVARLAAFGVRCIEGAVSSGALKRFDVDANFVTSELGGRDDTSLQRFAMPAGIGTLVIAGQCAQGGGQRLSVFGDKSKGLDIAWHTIGGDFLRFEAKSRSFAAGLSATVSASAIVASVVSRVRDAALSLGQRTRSDRVTCHKTAVVTGFFPSRVLRELENFDWDDDLSHCLMSFDNSDDAPHGVIINLFGFDIVEGIVDPFTVRRYFEVPCMVPATPAAVRAFGFLGGRRA